jgi:hypothetical protein
MKIRSVLSDLLLKLDRTERQGCGPAARANSDINLVRSVFRSPPHPARLQRIEARLREATSAEGQCYRMLD